MVKRGWKASAYRSESVAEPLCCLFFLHQVGGRREKVNGDPANRSSSENHPSLDLQSLSFRLQETTLTTPTTRKCDSFSEVFSPPSPRFFCLFASGLPCCPARRSHLVSPREAKRGISYGVSNLTLRYLFCASYSTFSLIVVALRRRSTCSVG